MRTLEPKEHPNTKMRKKLESPLLFLCLALMAIGLTLSPFVMGASQFLIMGVWFFTGDPVKSKIRRFFDNKIALAIVAIYLLHIIGLIYTSDFQYAFKDLKVKLPMLILPLVLSSVRPLEKKWFDLLMLIYVLSVFVATGISFITYIKHDYEDIRDISLFISHIRFCLNIVLAIGIVGYYLITRKTRWWEKLLQVALIVWFVFLIYIFESLSGYMALFGLVLATLLFGFFHKVKSTAWRLALLSAIIALPTIAGIYVYRTVAPMLSRPHVDFTTLEKQTALGNDYWHDTICFPAENGRYVGLYFCRTEMREAWNQRSNLDYDGQTLNGENLEATLARYLTSKDLRKDAAGVAALDEQDIRNVEQGVANYDNWCHPGLYSRLSETAFEYNQYHFYHNPNGGSLSQRIEYTKASLYLIKQHPVFGVGTGDIPNAYQQAYDELNSPLEPQYRYKAHNQYLSITVGLGLVGLLVFLCSLLVPYFASKRNRTYLYTVFMVILLLSMLPEDTIETQAGVMWFVFFNSLFIFALGNQEDDLQKQ